MGTNRREPRGGKWAGPAVVLVLFVMSLCGCGSGGGTETSQAEADPCDRTVEPGTKLRDAIARAASGSVLCLKGGRYAGVRIPAGVNRRSNHLTIRSTPPRAATIDGELSFDHAQHLRLEGLRLTGGIAFAPAATDIELIGNEITGPAGIFLFGDASLGGATRRVLIADNLIHDIDYTGSQATYNGYGIKSIGDQRDITVRDNTIQSVAADYIQTDVADEWDVEGNRFLGPSLAGAHPQEHQDLWQIYAGGTDVNFRGNVARQTGTDQSLLFEMTSPEDRYVGVHVVDNLFAHDSIGYTCQIYQARGLVFRLNTIVGSRWGCLFRDEPDLPAGSGYEIERNIFASTLEGADMGLEGRAGDWGQMDYNVSSDTSAPGPHSVHEWTPAWVNEIDYRPLGLPFAAGYRAPKGGG